MRKAKDIIHDSNPRVGFLLFGVLRPQPLNGRGDCNAVVLVNG